MVAPPSDFFKNWNHGSLLNTFEMRLLVILPNKITKITKEILNYLKLPVCQEVGGA